MKKRTGMIKAGLVMGLLVTGSTLFGLTQISGQKLQALVDSGTTVTVPAGDTYELILPDGRKITLAGGTVFQVVTKDGKVTVLSSDGGSGSGGGADSLLKNMPKKIETENKGYISPS